MDIVIKEIGRMKIPDQNFVVGFSLDTAYKYVQVFIDASKRLICERYGPVLGKIGMLQIDPIADVQQDFLYRQSLEFFLNI